jgi:TPR repeat protein
MAAAWYAKGAAAGEPSAMNNLGCLYQNGNGVNQDFQVAAAWYAKGAAAGDPSAMYNLGDCYRTGLGIAQDQTLAMKWLEKSAAAGFEPAETAVFDIKNPGVREANERANEGAQVDLRRRQREWDEKYNSATPLVRREMESQGRPSRPRAGWWLP